MAFIYSLVVFYYKVMEI